MTWNVYIVCGDNVADTNSVNGQQYTDQYIVQSLTATWFDAENHCENVIGTSLATIITDNDMEKAIINIISSGHDYQSTNLSFWIGLYRFKNNIWHWIERMDCNYTLTQNCKDDSHWQMNQPDELPESKYMGHYGAVLFIPDISNPYNNTYLYDMPFEDTNAMVLCNGPVSNYTIPTCSETFCWKQEKHLSDFTMILDVFGISHPYVAYWNSTLFLFGERQIHYTKFQMYSNDFHWKHSVWTTDPNGIQIGENANYAQVGSSFYILIYVSNRVTYAYDRGLVHVNLDTLDVKQITTITMDGAFPRTAYICMVADSKYVYLVRQGNIMHYQIASGQWTAADFDYDVPGFSETVYLNCIVTNDGKSIYIFSRTHSQDGAVAFWVIKYDTSLKQINYFNTTSLWNCVTISGNLSGRVMSDSGHFTNCICESFEKNCERMIKNDFNSLIIEIGRELQKKTNNAEICNTNGSLRYDQIRFEKNVHVTTKINEYVSDCIELEPIKYQV
eukprot:408038_1